MVSGDREFPATGCPPTSPPGGLGGSLGAGQARGWQGPSACCAGHCTRTVISWWKTVSGGKGVYHVLFGAQVVADALAKAVAEKLFVDILQPQLLHV